jgi:DNA invertase Pin-like site-specific DNA recombinase
MTDRITAEHLKRAAIVYVRQSSPEQVRNHAESTRIQVGLREKAVALGWRDPVTILDDLGISAGGFAQRAGFQHMTAEVSFGHVGIILCFEASRLSRNSKDWAQLFEICGHLDTLVADLDQIYDLALPDNRLILGVKGRVSEYELSLFRQRSQEAIIAKAKRGARQFTRPAGLSWAHRWPDRAEPRPARAAGDPDGVRHTPRVRQRSPGPDVAARRELIPAHAGERTAAGHPVATADLPDGAVHRAQPVLCRGLRVRSA